MIVKGAKTISELPDGSAVAEGFEFDIEIEPLKPLMRAAAIELILANTAAGELVRAAEEVLRYRGTIAEYPTSIAIEPAEHIPQSALDRLSQAVKNVRAGDPSKPPGVGN